MEREHTARTELFAQRREEVYARCPEYVRSTASCRARQRPLHAVLAAGDDPADAIEQSKTRTGYSKPSAARCSNRMDLVQTTWMRRLCAKPAATAAMSEPPCDCLKKRYAARLTEELSTILPITDQNFERFRLDYYSMCQMVV